MNPKDIIPKFRNFGFDLVFHQIDLNKGLDTLGRVYRREEMMELLRREREAITNNEFVERFDFEAGK